MTMRSYLGELEDIGGQNIAGGDSVTWVQHGWSNTALIHTITFTYRLGLAYCPQTPTAFARRDEWVKQTNSIAIVERVVCNLEKEVNSESRNL